MGDEGCDRGHRGVRGCKASEDHHRTFSVPFRDLISCTFKVSTEMTILRLQRVTTLSCDLETAIVEANYCSMVWSTMLGLCYTLMPRL